MLDLESLNPEQLEAVLTTEGPVLVLAGAGSGKTRVITYRLAYLIERGVLPKNILCVTFTNKAAYEMRVRARNLVGKSLRGATMSTFHALGSKILRDHPERVGLRSGFTICDGADQVGTVRRILRELRIDDRKFDAKRIMVDISKAKNAGLDATTYRERDGDLGEGDDDDREEDYAIATIEAYDKYERTLRAQNVVDFDDLLLLTQRLLEQHPDVLERLRQRWRYLMIDEYQDTNGSQFALMRMLAGAERNLCVVGDDDQSIYGWRGADIKNILGFDRHFPGAKLVKLETNYRSTANILDVANAIIEQNSERHDKRLKAIAGPGEVVKIVSVEDEDAEAELIANTIASLLTGKALAKEIAVLFRSNVQSRPIELAFRTAGVPYRVAGGMELFDRKEIRDLLAYLKVLDNPDDEQSLRRIINYPPRGIGDSSIEKIDDWGREQGLSLIAGLQKVDAVSGISARSADAISSFMGMLAEHRKLLGRRKASTVVRKLVEEIGLEVALFDSSDNGQTAGRRVDNVREIVRQIERFEQRNKIAVKRAEQQGALALEEDEDDFDSRPEASLSSFLAEIALGSRDDGSTQEERDDQVLLSTIHAAKGLEWQHVFLVGAEEELLPHARTVDGDGEIEEERRLAYVAVTRARLELTVTWAGSRTRWGRIVPRQRSRFMDGLPPDAVAFLEDHVEFARTEEEKDAIAHKYMAQIRSKLGM